MKSFFVFGKTAKPKWALAFADGSELTCLGERVDLLVYVE